MRKYLCLIAAAVVSALAVPAPQPFRFVLLGDRTGETQTGIFEQVLKESSTQKPAFYLTVGDMIQGLNDRTADAEWREAQKILAPYKRFQFFLAPGNHDIWSDTSEALFQKYSGHLSHYSFDYGISHFTVLDNSRSEQFAPEEIAFLEEDLKAHEKAPVKFIVSHRPSWIIQVLLHDTTFPLHRLAKKYGVQYVLSGHVHQMLHFALDGVEYVSMASAGGHLRASQRYEDGWFFGYSVVDVDRTSAAFQINNLDGRVTKLNDWGSSGLIAGRH